MHRLFVAIRPPEPIRDLLIDAMDDSADFRWQDDDQLHLTLRFVGEVDRPLAEDLALALTRVTTDPFTLRIAGTGRFEQRNSGALWAGVEPKAPVAALASKVERACVDVGIEPNAAPFIRTSPSPAGRAAERREVASFLERTRGLSSDPFAVTEFILFESRLSRHGAHYEPVTIYPLA